MKKHSPTRRLTLITMLLAMSILMHMIEPSLPIPIPGVKLGLANIRGVDHHVSFWHQVDDHAQFHACHHRFLYCVASSLGPVSGYRWAGWS